MFKSQNFCHIASNNRNLVKVGVFTYRTTDSLETVLTSGYFNERIIDINLHDLIIHEKISAIDSTVVERNILCVVERTLDNVGTTLIKSDWEKDIEQSIEDIEDIIENLDTIYLKLDGTSVMTGNLQTPNVRLTGKGGITAKVGSSDINLVKLNNDSALGKVEVGQGNVPTQVSSATFTHKLSGVDYKVLDNNDTATPVSDTNKVITQAEEQVLDNKIDTAANSGDQLYSTGVWYAKMYAGTTPPASVEGRNYADFSQTDGSGNPVIKVYTYTSGSWTLTDTIVPPAEYNGYMTITSKIWDISEQAGQQGGKVLWSHNQKTFTPYPQIISFDGANITNGSFQGVATLSNVSTAPTPTNDSPNNQIATKEYVDNATPSGSYHPDLFDHKWADHILNDVQWLRADTFSWQSGAVYQVAYQHLADDIDGKTLQSETVGGTTIQFYLADDGHKICPASEESNVSAIYNATGVAWYYIIDTANTRFKLPRINSDKELLNISAPVITAAEQMNTNGLPTLKFKTTSNGNPGGGGVAVDGSNNFIRTNQSLGSNKGNLVPSNLIANLSNATGLYKGKQYLYFYVGNFTQTALENTAGLNAELFNGKADLNLANVLANIDFVVESQEPTAGNGYTWYRKYRSGWVEQGGETTNTANSVVLPVEMADNHYVILRNFEGGGVQSQYPMWVAGYTSKTTTGFTFNVYSPVNVWYVCGKAAN